MGIEVLVHDLSNPTRSITAIEGGEVSGRSLEMGTTTLLVDLMRRVNQNHDKLNYELKIGARRFKCTTIPILRRTATRTCTSRRTFSARTSTARRRPARSISATARRKGFAVAFGRASP